ncbi:NUDIX hydrolase [Hymenobacter latericus]|uniref:NUDIX hydrolase n=1 Tax=Hymenobacter sp. YIM 151858-1 TaxID=2987688 RepID=UPI002225BA47|nr:NUDIX domain-containing protein [Hymenobacter sp. YIM 151858-1]UYZ58257.1 NUDIX domain-containing protein [Hymenobacter sp. YIM 151858-1]
MTTIDKIAWLLLDAEGRVLSTRSRGKDCYYFPGGKREPGETDAQTLLREIKEELTVDLDPESLQHLGTFTAQAHGHASGIRVQMTCYAARYQGTLQPAAEIEEVVWLRYHDRPRVSPVDQIIMDWLHAAGRLA